MHRNEFGTTATPYYFCNREKQSKPLKICAELVFCRVSLEGLTRYYNVNLRIPRTTKPPILFRHFRERPRVHEGRISTVRISDYGCGLLVYPYVYEVLGGACCLYGEQQVPHFLFNNIHKIIYLHEKHLCFILLLFVGELSWAQISNDKPKGQVVMITTKAYDEIYNFGEVSELKLRDEETVSYFDKRGNIIHERQIDYKGRIETAYLYTDEGKIIKEITTTPKATESAVVYDTLKLKLYTYDDSGRVKTESVFENKSLISKDRYEYTPTGYKNINMKEMGLYQVWQKKRE